MKRLIFLIFLALGILAILLFIYNPDLLEKVWLWIVGLIGVIISAIKGLVNGIANFFKNDKQKEEKSSIKEGSSLQAPAAPVVQSNSLTIKKYEDRIDELQIQIAILENQLKSTNAFDGYEGTTLTVLRYFDDGETTLGLLFLNNDFFCYTLEDTHREIKVLKETRIPQGTYQLGFNKYLTDLTKTYRKTRPWFEYHLHVKDVPNYEGVYIHVGNTIKDTAGCLLVADSINSGSAQRSIYNSRETFKRLYLKLKPIIDTEGLVRIRYYNEDWFQRFKLKQIVA